MQRLYIKFIEWNIQSLYRACKEAERLGYEKLSLRCAIEFEWTWVLWLDEYRTYGTTALSESQLIKGWYKEHKIENDDFQITKKYIKFQGEWQAMPFGFKWSWLLVMAEKGWYFTSIYREKQLISIWYTEHNTWDLDICEDLLELAEKQPEETSPIYMVFLPWRGAPTREHNTIQSARTELKRLFYEHKIEWVIVQKIEKLESTLSFKEC